MLDVIRGTPQTHDSLTVFPLIASRAVELPLVLMADAIADGTLEITEVEGGSVPELLATNTGASAILILDGEQLIGARQNRTTSRSIVVPVGKRTVIPVSCMEQGRWRFDSPDFKPSRHNSPVSVRRKTRDVEAAYATRGTPAAQSVLAEAQGAIWSDIAKKSADLGFRSETGALDQVYAARSDDIEKWIGDFPGQADQVGLLAFVGSRPIGMDVIGSTALYARLHERLLVGYVLDALTFRGGAIGVDPADAQGYLDRVQGANRVDSPTAGAGRYAVLQGEVVGGELTWEDRLAHLSAFPSSGEVEVAERPRFPGDPIVPPSRRRRMG